MPDISRSKCNQAMTFGQFAEYNVRSIWGTSPRFFSKRSKLSIYLDQYCEMLFSLLLLCVQVKCYQNILKER